MPAPTTHRFSVKDYYRLAETGVLRPGARVELLNGEIVDMSPIGPYHGGVVNRLIKLFGGLSRSRWLVSAQNPVRLDDHSEPEPDIALLKPSPDDYTSRHPLPEDVFLIVEVADSSLEYDRGDKLRAYGRAGVREVWIVNLSDCVIEMHREPHFTGYSSVEVHRPGQQIAPVAFPDAVVDVAALFRTGL